MQCHLSLKQIRVLIKYLILDFYFRRDLLVLCCEHLSPAGVGVSVVSCHRVSRQVHDFPGPVTVRTCRRPAGGAVRPRTAAPTLTACSVVCFKIHANLPPSEPRSGLYLYDKKNFKITLNSSVVETGLIGSLAKLALEEAQTPSSRPLPPQPPPSGRLWPTQRASPALDGPSG